MPDRLTMAPPALNVNEWRDAIRALFPDATLYPYRGSSIRSPYVLAVSHPNKVGEWYESGSYWIGNVDPEKPDTVGNAAFYSRVADLT